MTEKEMTEIKHGSENMCDLLNQEQTELKTAMIEELGNTLYCKQDKFDLSNPFEVAKAVVEEGYRKIHEGAVVLTEGEYSDLLFDEVATLKRDIAEYWANADFENVVKELHKNGYRKLDDHAIFVLRKAKGLEEKVRKETARGILELLYSQMPKTQIVVEIKKRYGVKITD